MKQAKPTSADSLAFLRFIQGLEMIAEHGMIPAENDAEAEDDEPMDIEQDSDVSRWLYRQWDVIGPIWQRVYWAGQTCIEIACDPNATTLEWKPELKAQEIQRQQMFELLTEIQNTCNSVEIYHPSEKPENDEPWLPASVMTRIKAVLQ